MNKQDQFYETVSKLEVANLATAAGESVTMRIVSPVLVDSAILIFTSKESTKYKQLSINPNCCISIGDFFVEAKAELLGSTMLDENETLRLEYDKKFPGAFAEGMEFGGRDSDFILLRPTVMSGWAFENDVPNEIGIPTIPFRITV